MNGTTAAKALAGLRLFLGFGFLYGGLSTLFTIGANAPFTSAPLLKFGTGGTWPGVPMATEGVAPVVVNPTVDLWLAIAGSPTGVAITDAIIIYGQLAIGIALMIGLATRFWALTGAIMMAVLTVAMWDFGMGFVNLTTLYAAVAVFLAATHAGKVYGLDGLLEKAAALRDHRSTRRFVGALA